jgi:hypothetical protein
MIPEEGELPTEIKIKAYELEKADNGQWNKVGSKIYDGTIPNTLPADLPLGVIREEVNLSTGSEQDFNKNPHIAAVPGLAARIKSARDRRPEKAFYSWEDLRLRPDEEALLATLKTDKWLKLHD